MPRHKRTSDGRRGVVAAAPFWAGAPPRTPPRPTPPTTAPGAPAGRSSLSPIPSVRRQADAGRAARLSPTYEAGTPPPEGIDHKTLWAAAVRAAAAVAFLLRRRAGAAGTAARTTGTWVPVVVAGAGGELARPEVRAGRPGRRWGGRRDRGVSRPKEVTYTEA